MPSGTKTQKHFERSESTVCYECLVPKGQLEFWQFNVRAEMKNICRIAFHNTINSLVFKPCISDFLDD